MDLPDYVVPSATADGYVAGEVVEEVRPRVAREPQRADTPAPAPAFSPPPALKHAPALADVTFEADGWSVTLKYVDVLVAPNGVEELVVLIGTAGMAAETFTMSSTICCGLKVNGEQLPGKYTGLGCSFAYNGLMFTLLGRVNG
jgi:hypothetical protein